MISLKEVSDNLHIDQKKIRYYLYLKEVKYIIKDDKFYLDEKEFILLKKIVLFRRLGFSLEEIDDMKKDKNLTKLLIKMDNLIPYDNRYSTIKIIINEMLKDNVTFYNLNEDKYLDMIFRFRLEGKKFYSFNEDITYEDYKSSKFNVEYLIMITFLTILFVIFSLISKKENAFMLYFPFFFSGLILTLFIFYIPIKVKYYKRIMGLLRRNYHEE